jgi:GTPase
MNMTKLPTIAIVGKPNVGKSTLFNALIKKRDAIALDISGVTRDRHVDVCRTANTTFALIDTGGYETEPEDFIFGEIKVQINSAISESDLLILLMDGAGGITRDDRDILDLLRQSGKKFILAVNKIDVESHSERLYDFYELGVETIIPISAEHRRNIDLLMSEIENNIPIMHLDIQEERDRLKIAILGRPNVGKSSLVNKILGDYRVIVSEIPGTTRDSIDTDFSYQDDHFVIIDTAGIRRKGKTKGSIDKISVIKALDSIERSDVCVLLIDSYEGITDQDAHVLGYIIDAGKPIIIAANKWDLVEKDKKNIEEITKKITYKLKFAPYAPLVFISALSGQRVFKILELAKDIYANASFRIPTAEYNRLMSDVVKKHSLPIHRNRRIKIYYSAQVAIKPPTFLLVTNDVEGMHFSYLRYVENMIREYHPFTGVPIRIKLKKRRSKENPISD